eukprot:gene20245-22228_t
MLLQQQDEIMAQRGPVDGMLVQKDDECKNNNEEMNSGSLRRRKFGAFARPNVIDFVGQPKHKNSILHDCLLDELTEEKTGENNEEDQSKACGRNNLLAATSELDECCFEKTEEKSEKLECLLYYADELTDFIDSLVLADVDNEEDIDHPQVQKEDRQTPISTIANKSKNNCNNRIACNENVAKQSNKKEDYADVTIGKPAPRYVHSLPRKSDGGMRCPDNRNNRDRDIKRTCSLPVTRESKSRLRTAIATLRNKNKNNNNVNQSSDGEGSAQSMMSFDSNGSSSCSKRTRSASLLSRLSRTSSSPMTDKRSRSGSLPRNRTGCPQYFIPGENKGRALMPTIDLFETSSLCLKGIRFRIKRNMPRTHRAVSLAGCMGFVVPAPSAYFER